MLHNDYSQLSYDLKVKISEATYGIHGGSLRGNHDFLDLRIGTHGFSE